MTVEAGSRLGPYEILAPLGSGGMGEVFRAKDPRLGREVAVKVLPNEFAQDADRSRRFEQEARAVSALNHPNILTVHDVGREGGVAFIVTELLTGESLREVLRRGPLPVKRAVEAAKQVARGLAAAHERGIVHRDLKPENLFITREGSAKILDFGLARRERPEASTASIAGASTLLETEAGMVLGTVGYMAPEQVRGERADARSDLFSLGCVLYEMLGGRRAFPGATAVESLNAILKDEPPALASSGRAIPPALDRIVRHCLEKDPEHRRHSAHDLAFDLQAISSAAAEEPFTSRRRTSRRWMAVAGAVALLLAVALGALAYRALRPNVPSAPPTLRYLTFSSHDRQPAIAPDGRMIAFVSERDGSSRIWLKRLDSGDETALTDGPDTFPRFLPDGSAILFTRSGNDGAAIFRVGVLGGAPRRLVQDGAEADVSPDGGRLVFVRTDRPPSPPRSRLLVSDTDGGGERELADAEDFVFRRPLWSPDGREIAAIENGGGSLTISGKLVVFAADSGARRELASAPYSLPFAVAWSGSDLLYARPEAQALRAGSTRLLLIDGKGGEGRSVLSSPDSVEGLDISGAGQLILDVASLHRNLQEVRIGAGADGESPRWLTRGSSSDSSPTYTPDGEWIVFASDRGGNLDIWAVARSTGAIRRLTDHPAEDWDPAFTRDGKHLLWSSNRSGNFEVWMAEADGTGARQLSHDGRAAENPSASPDGEWIVYGSVNPQGSGVWKTRLDGSSATHLAGSGVVLPEVSPDGRFVAYVTGSRVECVRFDDGKLVAPPVLADGARIRWMPDGKGLALLTRGARGTLSLFRLEFDPVAGISSDRRPLITAIPSADLRVFGLSPDGTWATFGVQERANHLLLADGVPGVGFPRRAPR